MNTTLKILMLEDNESDAGLILRTLKKANFSFDYIRVDSKETYIKALAQYAPSVILSDHSLPMFNSFEAYEIYKRTKLNIPFILVTGTVSEEFAVNSLHQGIDDYILKDNLTRLPTAIENALKKRALEDEKRKLEKEQIEYAEKLKSQNEELVKINKELDRFVYSASHELKAPLKSILGLINLTQMEINSSQCIISEDYLRLMEKSVDKLSNTVEEIIYYSINSRLGIEKEEIDANELIDSVWEKLSYLEGIHQIEKIVNVEQSSVWYSDLNRLVIILDSLISNSVKYRNKELSNSFVAIKVQVFPEKVFLIVEDNGIGIPAKYIDRIFEMFFRISSLSDGAGLGLYIVKETVDKLNGKIEVYSDVNSGTIVKIELPNL